MNLKLLKYLLFLFFEGQMHRNQSQFYQGPYVLHYIPGFMLQFCKNFQTNLNTLVTKYKDALIFDFAHNINPK